MTRIARNHTGHRVGEHHQHARLTDRKVVRMRHLRETDPATWTYAALAVEFGCGMSTVRDIVRYWTRSSAI